MDYDKVSAADFSTATYSGASLIAASSASASAPFTTYNTGAYNYKDYNSTQTSKTPLLFVSFFNFRTREIRTRLLLLSTHTTSLSRLPNVPTQLHQLSAVHHVHSGRRSRLQCRHVHAAERIRRWVAVEKKGTFWWARSYKLDYLNGRSSSTAGAFGMTNTWRSASQFSGARMRLSVRTWRCAKLDVINRAHFHPSSFYSPKLELLQLPDDQQLQLRSSRCRHLCFWHHRQQPGQCQHRPGTRDHCPAELTPRHLRHRSSPRSATHADRPRVLHVFRLFIGFQLLRQLHVDSEDVSGKGESRRCQQQQLWVIDLVFFFILSYQLQSTRKAVNAWTAVCRTLHSGVETARDTICATRADSTTRWTRRTGRWWSRRSDR